MRLHLPILSAALIFVPLATAQAACDWSRVTNDMNWCLRTGTGVHARGEMEGHLRAGDVNRMGGVQIAFDKCQDHNPEARAHFSHCKNEDQGRLYNIGREILGLPKS